MDILPLVRPGVAAQPPPQVTADLRPAADAAALIRDPRPVVSATSILPAPLAQLAEVSRSLVAVAAEEGPPAVQRAERLLKPWGITMLPATGDNHPRKAATMADRPATPG